MKNVNAVATFVGIFFLTVSFTLPKNRTQLKLEPGLYIVTSNQGSEFELNQTGKFYSVQKVPILNIKHITSTSLGVTPLMNGKKYATLTLTLDAIGIAAINKVENEQEIGLILNSKLRSVARYMAFGSFKGPSIKIQAGPDDGFDDFKELKKDIDALH